MASRVKVRNRTVYSIAIDEKSFEVTHPPCEWMDIIIKTKPSGETVVGYLSRDEDCSNPLDDCDGLGKIYDRRGRSRETESLCREAMGIDEHGNTEDEDGEPYPKNPHCVVLDVHSHSGDTWRVHGGGRYFPDERWDVSNGAGVWLPDDACETHILIRAAGETLKPHPWYEQRREWGYCTQTKKPPHPEPPADELASITQKYHSQPDTKSFYTYGYTLPGGIKSAEEYKTVIDAAKAAAAVLGVTWDDELYLKNQRQEAHLCASQAVETYNHWCSGSCYGVCVDVFSPEGELIEDDACWGFIGDEYPEESLQEEVARRLKPPAQQ